MLIFREFAQYYFEFFFVLLCYIVMLIVMSILIYIIVSIIMCIIMSIIINIGLLFQLFSVVRQKIDLRRGCGKRSVLHPLCCCTLGDPRPFCCYRANQLPRGGGPEWGAFKSGWTGFASGEKGIPENLGRPEEAPQSLPGVWD